jgi:hypothetical protein
MEKFLDKHLYEKISIAPLAMFRIIFGFMMLISIIRFAYNGWIFDQYIYPDFYFNYYGFEWVKPLGSQGMYTLFGLMALSALAMMLGLFYRFASIIFFLTFTYVELIDKTNYLNHYYFISLVSFLMVFLPAHRYFSLDVLMRPSLKRTLVPAWTINIIKFQLGTVYFFAGLAKLNYDWLVNAMPLKIWLPAKTNVPLIGWLFNYKWSATLFSWCGAIYDLFIPFLLLNKYTRGFAYMAVIAFHVMTAMLFQIGMFPYIMILSTLIFFPASFHQRIIDFLSFGIAKTGTALTNPITFGPTGMMKKVGKYALITYMVVQLLLPFRFLMYPDNLFWTEEGYRFSWRVMLMEKAGYVVFHVYDPETEKIEQVNNYTYLTKVQEKQMSTQPDMILQFAHFLKEKYKEKGFIDPQIRAESYVTLNGRRSQVFIDPTVNLTEIEEGWQHKDWVMPMKK